MAILQPLLYFREFYTIPQIPLNPKCFAECLYQTWDLLLSKINELEEIDYPMQLATLSLKARLNLSVEKQAHSVFQIHEITLMT